MHTDKRRIYRKGSTPRLIVTICLGIAALLLCLYIFFFFYFQRYIVPTEDGVKVVVPWLTEETADDTAS